MLVYLDESGDLGWNFSNPYMQGGSSRFLTIAFLLIPPKWRHLPKRIIRGMYSKYKWPTTKERKASHLSHNQKVYFCKEVSELIKKDYNIVLRSITVRKENVEEHIRSDSNLLYNYMTKLCIIDDLSKHQKIEIISDKRSIKVKSGNSFAEYLQTTLWFDQNTNTKLIHSPSDSHSNYNLQFVDFLVHCIWCNYEFQNNTYFDILSSFTFNKKLFF